MLETSLEPARAAPPPKRSWNLMEKLGMTYNPKDDFYHTKLPKDHPLAFHLLYRKQNTSSD